METLIISFFGLAATYIFMIFIVFILWINAIVEVIRSKKERGSDKIVWMMLLLLMPPIGTIIWTVRSLVKEIIEIIYRDDPIIKERTEEQERYDKKGEWKI
jgi:uncharacterized membrane protein YhaH (DUF805 family)